MAVSTEINNSEDVIDSRDVIARIEYLEGLPACVHCGEIIDYDAGSKTWELHDGDEPHVCTAGGAHEPDADGEELASLADLAEEAGGYSPDWIYGATLIRDSYFRTTPRSTPKRSGGWITRPSGRIRASTGTKPRGSSRPTIARSTSRA